MKWDFGFHQVVLKRVCSKNDKLYVLAISISYKIAQYMIHLAEIV